MRISDWSSDVCSSDLDAQRPSGANGDGGLDVEVLGHYLLTGLGGGLLGRLTNGAHEIAFIVADRQFGADAKKGRKHDALEHLPAMEVDLIFKTGIAGGIGGGQIVDLDRDRKSTRLNTST